MGYDSTHSEHTEPPEALSSMNQDRQMAVIAMMFSVLKDRLPDGMGYEAFAEFASRFDLVPISIGGALVGAIMVLRNRVHAVTIPAAKGRWYSKRIHRYLQSLQRHYGELTTCVEDGYAVGHEFAARLGFKPTIRRNNVTEYVRGNQ